MVLLQCDTLRRFRVDASLIEVLSRLDDWLTLQELVRKGSGVSATELAELVVLGVVERDDEHSGVGTAAGHDSGRRWEPIDLAAQRRSNVGGFRPEDSTLQEGPPAAFHRPSGYSVVLPSPERLLGEFEAILAARRSARTYGDRSLKLVELSTVLHHAAQVRQVNRDPILGDTAVRPFASAGGRCELEIYVVANDVEGLEAGAHYYDPRAHDLVRIRRRDGHQERLNHSVDAAAGGFLSRDPPVVLLVTAVFARVMWKYRDMGLALIYKDVGCLLQILYLVATAMGLAPCAIGGGEETANDQWLGLDPLVESQVGCFLLGPRPQAAS